jgi:hypothetical protein
MNAIKKEGQVCLNLGPNPKSRVMQPRSHSSQVGLAHDEAQI